MVDRVIRVIVDPSQALIGARQINRALETTGQKVNSVRGTFGNLSNSIRAFAGALALNEIRQFADTATLLENRIRLVTNSTAELNAVSDELFKVSQETRVSFEGSVELYARVARSTKALGLSQRDVIDITTAVNQAVQISGATAQEASNAIIQFSQGLASGALRGEELRSVLEQIPRLAIGLADGLNLNAEALAKINNAAPEDRLEATIGTLRQLGAEGKLTTDVVVAAVQRIAPEFQAEFDQLTRTSDQALVQVRNSIIRFVDELDDEINFSGGITGLIDVVREAIDSATARIPELSDALEVFISDSESFGDGFEDASKLIERTATNLSNLFNDGSEDADAFTSRMRTEFPRAFKVLDFAAEDTVGFLIQTFGRLPGNIESSVRIVTFELAGLFDELVFSAKSKIFELRTFVNRELEFIAEGIRDTASGQLGGEGFFGDAIASASEFASFISPTFRTIMSGLTEIKEEAAKVKFGGEDSELNASFAQALQDIENSRNALAKSRNEETQRLREQEEERTKIVEENRQEREVAAAAEEAARKALENKGTKKETNNVNAEATEDADKLLEKLKAQTLELRLQNEFGDAAEQQQRQALITQLELSGASQSRVNALRDVTTELAIQERIAGEIANEESDLKETRALELKLKLLEAEGDERFKILAIQQLSIDASDEQIARTAALIKKIEETEEAQKNQLITLEEIDKQFAEGVGDAIGTFLNDVESGFDGIRDAFANLLSDLAIEILKNIIVTQFFESFLGSGSSGGGIFSRIFSSFATKGAQEGRGVGSGEAIVVGEKEAEIFVPTQQGTVVPGRNIQTGGGDVIILNDPDPGAVLSALSTRQGARVQRNRSTADERKTKRQLGLI